MNADMPQRPLRILGISGSLRRGAYNSRLLEAGARRLPPEVEYVRLGALKTVPPYDADDEAEGLPAAVSALRRQIEWADGLIVATPEYNWSIPGQLKNAIDWASRPPETAPLRNKDVLVIGASTSAFGAVWAQADLRRVLSGAGARVLDDALAMASAHEQFDDDAELRDPELGASLADLVDRLLDEVRTSVRAARAAAVEPQL